MPFTIVRNDITKMETEAIVNAANTELVADGGAGGAIFAAANSDRLAEECRKIGRINVGEAVITKGYGLPAKYIIHTSGPIYENTSDEREKLLYSCYINSLKLAKKKRIRSIAFPLISSGNFGYPKAEALRIATSAVRSFLNENEMDVYLVVYDKESFEVSEGLFERVSSYIDEVSVRGSRYARFNEANNTSYPCSPLFNAAPSLEDAYDGAPEVCQKTVSAEIPAFTKIDKPRCLENLLNKKVETFSQMLLRLIHEKGMTDVEVYKRANIDRKLFSKIRGKNYTPRKHTVIALAIALRLNLDETKDLLRRAGFAFSECDKFDVIIEYFLENEEYDIFEINETLFYFDRQLLGV